MLNDTLVGCAALLSDGTLKVSVQMLRELGAVKGAIGSLAVGAGQIVLAAVRGRVAKRADRRDRCSCCRKTET